MSIMRLATKPIISLRRSSSEPFSTSAFRVILSIVMVRSLGCVWSFATRANLDSDHDSFPLPAPLWTPWGKGLQGRCSPAGLRPPSVQRPPLHHASGRQLNRRLRRLHPEVLATVFAGIARFGGTAIADAVTDLLTVNGEPCRLSWSDVATRRPVPSDG